MKTPNGIPQKRGQRAFTWAWPYHDGENNIVGHVARFDAPEGKEVIPFFRKRGTAWEPGIPEGTRAPLFGQKSVAGQHEVYVVEGERCAAALHLLGLPSVTSQGGSKSAQKSDWGPLGEAGRVYLLPDSDEPGQAYMADVAKALAALPGQREVFMAALPGLSPGDTGPPRRYRRVA